MPSRLSHYSRIRATDETYKEIASAERYTTRGIPAFALQEVACIVNKQILDSGIQDDGFKWPFRARSDVAPIVGTMKIDKKMSSRMHNRGLTSQRRKSKLCVPGQPDIPSWPPTVAD
jgi:hypothetical protein